MSRQESESVSWSPLFGSKNPESRWHSGWAGADPQRSDFQKQVGECPHSLRLLYHYARLPGRVMLPRCNTGSGWASVLKTQFSKGSRSSLENSRYRYLQHRKKSLSQYRNFFYISEPCALPGIQLITSIAWVSPFRPIFHIKPAVMQLHQQAAITFNKAECPVKFTELCFWTFKLVHVFIQRNNTITSVFNVSTFTCTQIWESEKNSFTWESLPGRSSAGRHRKWGWRSRRL